MITIWKFELYNPITGANPIAKMPNNARILCVKNQYGSLCLWAEVDDQWPTVFWTFMLVGTGKEVPESAGEYIGTVLLDEGDLVLHVYHSTPR